jgi:hypothetical protein
MRTGTAVGKREARDVCCFAKKDASEEPALRPVQGKLIGTGVLRLKHPRDPKKWLEEVRRRPGTKLEEQL